jgi:hypothetical protein
VQNARLFFEHCIIGINHRIGCCQRLQNEPVDMDGVHVVELSDVFNGAVVEGPRGPLHALQEIAAVDGSVGDAANGWPRLLFRSILCKRFWIEQAGTVALIGEPS